MEAVAEVRAVVVCMEAAEMVAEASMAREPLERVVASQVAATAAVAGSER